MYTVMRYKKYAHAPACTFLSWIGGFLMAIGIPCTILGVFYLITSASTRDKNDATYITVAGIVGLALGYAIKKLADYLATNKAKKIILARGPVRDITISPTRIDGRCLYISCPKCGNEVEVTNTCKACGSDIWHTDVLYKKDIENIWSSPNYVQMLENKNEQYKQQNS